MQKQIGEGRGGRGEQKKNQKKPETSTNKCPRLLLFSFCVAVNWWGCGPPIKQKLTATRLIQLNSPNSIQFNSIFNSIPPARPIEFDIAVFSLNPRQQQSLAVLGIFCLFPFLFINLLLAGSCVCVVVCARLQVPFVPCLLSLRLPCK